MNNFRIIEHNQLLSNGLRGGSIGPRRLGAFIVIVVVIVVVRGDSPGLVVPASVSDFGLDFQNRFQCRVRRADRSPIPPLRTRVFLVPPAPIRLLGSLTDCYPSRGATGIRMAQRTSDAVFYAVAAAVLLWTASPGHILHHR